MLWIMSGTFNYHYEKVMRPNGKLRLLQGFKIEKHAKRSCSHELIVVNKSADTEIELGQIH